MTDAPLPHLRIIALEAENFMKLTAVNIRPDGALVEITGKNGNGKTSVLNAIWAALGGTRAVPAVPIRRGEEQALIRLDLGEIRVTRKFKLLEDGDYTTSLVVESAEGARFSKPQDVLNALVGELSFDPLAFTRMAPKDQFNTARRFVPGFDFDALAAASRADFEKRTTVKRRAAELRAQADGIVLPAGKTPERVDVAALERKLGDAATHNTDVARRKDARAAAEQRLEALSNEEDDLNRRLRAIAEETAEIRKRLDEAPPLPAPIDVAQVQADLTNARDTNRYCDRAEEKARLAGAAALEEKEADRLTKAIEAREEEKRAAIAKAKMPVHGLSFGDDEILLDGLPFAQASDAMQLRTSIAIAGALNPTLRVIRVRDGSLLDDDALRLLESYAVEHDLQVWIEKVDSSGKIGFVLEDGHLKGEGPPPAAALEEEDTV